MSEVTKTIVFASVLITMHLSDVLSISVLSSYERFYIKKHRYFKLRVHVTFHHMIIYMYHCILI